MKMVVLDGAVANPGDLSWDIFKEFGEVTVYSDTSPGQLAEHLGDAEAVLTNKTPMGRDVFAAHPQLRYIGLLATGYNQIDVQAAKECGITVCNVPGYSTHSVAQHTVALLLEICNQVGLHSTAVHEGRWSQSGKWCFWERPLTELAGKTMGIIGFGSIGRATGAIAKALGMRVLATGSRETPQGLAVGEYVPLDTLLQTADVISLHCPLLPETQGIINKENIAKMKDSVILLNTARGGLVVDAELASALNSGKVYAAGLDVVSKEPIPADSPLLGARNCFLTPHIAWVATETRQRLFRMVSENLRAYLAGAPIHVVNP